MPQLPYLCNGCSVPGSLTHPLSWLSLPVPGACIQGQKVWAVQEDAYVLILHGRMEGLMWFWGPTLPLGLWLVFLDLPIPEYRWVAASCPEAQ